MVTYLGEVASRGGKTDGEIERKIETKRHLRTCSIVNLWRNYAKEILKK